MAALVKQCFPGYTPDQVADYLKHYAEQREAPDPNNTWGHGFAVLPPPGTELPPDFESSCGGTITADSTVQGQWMKDCNSETPAPGQGGSGARLARYYTFTLTENADVSLILESDDAETVLYLREGIGVRSGEPMESNEGESDYNYRRASVQRSLNAGTYTIEATTYNTGETGSFTLSLSVARDTTPPPVAGDCGIADVATDGSSVTGSWGNDCQSEVTADRNARYYTFTLDQDAEVTIELTADADEPVLHLRDGDSKTGTEIAKHEGFQDEGYKRAEIVQDLEAGKTYTIKARTYSEGYEGPFTLTVSVAGGTCGVPVATAFAPLGDNLLWVAQYDNATGDVSVYDPSGTFSLSDFPTNGGVSLSGVINNLAHVVSGGIYWIKVIQNQTVPLSGETITLYAGFNPISWP